MKLLFLCVFKKLKVGETGEVSTLFFILLLMAFQLWPLSGAVLGDLWQLL